MKLQHISSVMIFLSAYSPLSIIFLIQDWDSKQQCLSHPVLVITMLVVSVLSCILVWYSMHALKCATPPVTIKSVSNRSGELINYSIPYMITGHYNEHPSSAIALRDSERKDDYLGFYDEIANP